MGGRGSSQVHGVTTLTLTLLMFLMAGALPEGQGQEIMSDVAQNVCTVKGRVYSSRE